MNKRESLQNLSSGQHLVAMHGVTECACHSVPRPCFKSIRCLIIARTSNTRSHTQINYSMRFLGTHWFIIYHTAASRRLGAALFLRLTQLWMAWLHRSEATRQCARTHTINIGSGAFPVRYQQHAHVWMQRRSNISTLAVLSAMASLDCFFDALYQCCATFLQRCVNKCSHSTQALFSTCLA